MQDRELKRHHRSNIFVCYRRGDSGAYAGRMYDLLAAHFGRSNVFIDLDGIAPGEDFAGALDSALQSCRAVIPVIGPKWLTVTDKNGRRRLDDPKDLVRAEIAAALRRDTKVLVIPALVDGANMPSEGDLPEDIKSLSKRNALVLTDIRWKRDVGELITALDAVMPRNRYKRLMKFGLAAVLGVCLILLLVMALTRWMDQPSARMPVPPHVAWAYDPDSETLALQFPLEVINTGSEDVDFLAVLGTLEAGTNPSSIIGQFDLADLRCFENGKPGPDRLHVAQKARRSLNCSPVVNLKREVYTSLGDITPLRFTVELKNETQVIPPLYFCFTLAGQTGRFSHPQCIEGDF
jgi:hypothetical protein